MHKAKPDLYCVVQYLHWCFFIVAISRI